MNFKTSHKAIQTLEFASINFLCYPINPEKLKEKNCSKRPFKNGGVKERNNESATYKKGTKFLEAKKISTY